MAIAETCNRGEEDTLRASAGRMDIRRDLLSVEFHMIDRFDWSRDMEWLACWTDVYVGPIGNTSLAIHLIACI